MNIPELICPLCESSIEVEFGEPDMPLAAGGGYPGTAHVYYCMNDECNFDCEQHLSLNDLRDWDSIVDAELEDLKAEARLQDQEFDDNYDY